MFNFIALLKRLECAFLKKFLASAIQKCTEISFVLLEIIRTSPEEVQ